MAACGILSPKPEPHLQEVLFIVSWKASGWAKGTRGHKSHGQKLVLMILADYYDDERGFAWPSQARLSEDCEMSLRTIQWALRQLQDGGYVTRLQKGNQYQPSKWALHLADAHLREPAISEPATIAGAGEPARSHTVNPQDPAGEPASPVGTSLQEPEEEEPPEDIETPEWLSILRETEGWPTKGRPYEESLIAWVGKKGYAVHLLEGSAIALGKVQWKTLRGYRNLSRAFQDRLMKGWDDPSNQTGFPDNGSRPQGGRKQARGAAAWGVEE